RADAGDPVTAGPESPARPVEGQGLPRRDEPGAGRAAARPGLRRRGVARRARERRPQLHLRSLDAAEQKAGERRPPGAGGLRAGQPGPREAGRVDPAARRPVDEEVRKRDIRAVFLDAGNTLVELDYEVIAERIRADGHRVAADQVRRAEQR